MNIPSKRRASCRRRLRVQALESRRLLATYYWDYTKAAEGDWQDPSNWDTSAALTTPVEERLETPGKNDDAVIEFPDGSGDVTAAAVDVDNLRLFNASIKIKDEANIGGFSAGNSSVVWAKGGYVGSATVHDVEFSSDGGDLEIGSLSANSSEINLHSGKLEIGSLSIQQSEASIEASSFLAGVVAFSDDSTVNLRPGSGQITTLSGTGQKSKVVVNGGSLDIGSFQVDQFASLIGNGSQIQVTNDIDTQANITIVGGRFASGAVSLDPGSVFSVNGGQVESSANYRLRESRFSAAGDSDVQIGSLTVDEGELIILQSKLSVEDILDIDDGVLTVNNSKLNGRALKVDSPTKRVILTNVDEFDFIEVQFDGADVDISGTALRADSIWLDDGSMTVGTGSSILANSFFRATTSFLNADENPAPTLTITGGTVVVGQPDSDIGNRKIPGQLTILPTGKMFIGGIVEVDTVHAIGDGELDALQGKTSQLNGYGTIRGNLINEGAVALLGGVSNTLGIDYGRLLITGDYTQFSHATLGFDFGGDHERLNRLEVQGQASLGGTLQVHGLHFAPLGTRQKLVVLKDKDALDGRFSEIEGTSMAGLNSSLRFGDDKFLAIHYDSIDAAVEAFVAETPRLYPLTNSPAPPFFGALSPRFAATQLSSSKPVLREGLSTHLVLIVPGSAADANAHPELEKNAPPKPPDESCPIEHPDVRPLNDRLASSQKFHDLALAIEKADTQDRYDVATVDWSQFSTDHPHDTEDPCDWKPTKAVTQAISLGESLARYFEAIDLTQYESVHLFSHSAGSWFVDAFADYSVDADLFDEIHLTLFDAYIPRLINTQFEPVVWAERLASWRFFKDTTPPIRWGSNPEPHGDDRYLTSFDLGDSATYREHYVDTRLNELVFPPDTPPIAIVIPNPIPGFPDIVIPIDVPLLPAVPLTNDYLPNFINIDVTKFESDMTNFESPTGIEPLPSEELLNFSHPSRLYSHSWPSIFYLKTVDGTFQTGDYFGFKNTIETLGDSRILARQKQFFGYPITFIIQRDGTVTTRHGTVVPGEQISTRGDGELRREAGSLRLSTNATFSLEFDIPDPRQGRALSISLMPDFEPTGFLEVSIGSDAHRIEPAAILAAGLRIEIPFRIENESQEIPTVSIQLNAREGETAQIHFEKIELLYETNQFAALQNHQLPADVDNNGVVTAGDALNIINKIVRDGGLFVPIHLTGFPDSFYDVSGDSKVTAVDALMVINYLVQQQLAGGEAELDSEQLVPTAPPTDIMRYNKDEKDDDQLIEDLELWLTLVQRKPAT